ncbi:hypothetical protein [Streptomyces nigra]
MPADFLEVTRASYDTIAAAYTDRFPNRPGDWHPLDRSLIGAFAEPAAVHAPAPAWWPWPGAPIPRRVSTSAR